ncbi:hypothetical protein PCA10_42530 [Metapseudomonas resinovorans NBRC 106553]|uniref:Uncharacterized protein n=1 Tax=Metapseudomonas resinovorans NBRC 106553 TaxID=1245471 RepID=S6AMC2_METRE|nr:hypothetical protein PCA10_42530 [Pseudomonas resinovorans NBRC 106553]
MKVRIEFGVTRLLEETAEEFGAFGRGPLLVQVEDQHLVVTDAGEFVAGIPRHQAGAHPAHFSATAIHLELGTAGKGQHQLVVIVGMVMGLMVQAQETGFEHGRTVQNLRILSGATRVAQRHPAAGRSAGWLKCPLPCPI